MFPVLFPLVCVCAGRLSGESPFQGDNITETQALVTAARYEFDEESSEDISDEARGFISSLLQKDPRLVQGHTLRKHMQIDQTRSTLRKHLHQVDNTCVV